MNSNQTNRDELKRRLKEKIRNKRSNDHTAPQLVQRLRDDPATALMSMGIDDANVLNNAKEIIQMSKTLLGNSAKKREMSNEAKEDISNSKDEKSRAEDDDESEDEAPPPLS